MKRGHALAVVALLAASTPRGARAMGAVVTSGDDGVAMTNVRVAVAAAPGRTTRWVQISTTPAPSGFGWLVPVAPGARVDLADDAWLDALDAATVPAILPPAAAPPCPVPITPQVIAPGTSPSSQAPTNAVLALDMPSLLAVASAAAWTVSPDLAQALAGFYSSGQAVLALAYPASAVPTRTLRIVDPGAASFPFALTAPGTPVTAFALGGSALLPSGAEVTVSPSALSWLGTGASSYGTLAATLLSESGPDAWLAEDEGPTAFFQPTSVSASASLPSVVAGYYNLASLYGESTADPSACAASALSLDTGDSPFVAVCAPGALAVAPPATACALGDGGATPIDGLVCGNAVDAAFAASGLSPADLWITRSESNTTGGADLPLVLAATPIRGPVLQASGYAVACSVGVLGFDAGEDDGGDGDGGGDDAGDEGSGEGAWSGGGEGYGSGGGGDDSDPGYYSGYYGSGEGSGGGGLAVDLDAPSSSGCDSSSTGDDASDADDCSGDSSGADAGGCSGGDDDVSTCSSGRRGGRHGRSPMSRVLLFGAGALVFFRRRGKREEHRGA